MNINEVAECIGREVTITNLKDVEICQELKAAIRNKAEMVIHHITDNNMVCLYSNGDYITVPARGIELPN